MALAVTLSLCPIFSVDNTSPYLLSPPISALASVDAILYLFIFANDERSWFSINPYTHPYLKTDNAGDHILFSVKDSKHELVKILM